MYVSILADFNGLNDILRERAMKKIFLTALLAILPMGFVVANDTTNIDAVDVIDHDFGTGGGSFTGNNAGGTDDSWVVFTGAAGEVVTVETTSAQSLVVVVLRETTNGTVEVGDALNIADFNPDNTGQVGTDFVVVQDDENGTTTTQTVTLPAAGEYAIALARGNSSGGAQSFTVTLSGAGRAVTGIPTLSEYGLILLALSLLGFGIYQRRRPGNIV